MCNHHRRDEDARSAAPIVTTTAAHRVSDAERERVLDQLRAHAGDGRLSLDEFGDRVSEALAARTGAELTAALRELPRVVTEREMSAERRAVVRPFVLVMALLVGIWAVTGFGFPWPVFPLLGWGLPVLSAWRSAPEDIARSRRTAVS